MENGHAGSFGRPFSYSASVLWTDQPLQLDFMSKFRDYGAQLYNRNSHGTGQNLLDCGMKHTGWTQNTEKYKSK
ncbi:hypothetical protein MHYP_G00008990 [Metynnis hypsauchen]